MTRIRDIRVAVLGASNSGRTTIVNRMQHRLFQRQGDGRTFQFIAEELEEPHSRIWETFEFVVITFSLEGSPKSAVDLANQVSVSAPRRELICLLGTKLDLFPQDLSDEDLHRRGFATQLAYYADLQYFSIGLMNDDGIKDACKHIGHYSLLVCTLFVLMNKLAMQTLPLDCSSQFSAFLGLKSLFGRLATWSLDTIAETFALQVPTKGNQDTPDADDVDERSITALLRHPDTLKWDAMLSKYSTFQSKFVPAHKITPNLLVKSSPSISERENMAFVRKHTTIPVPQPRYPQISSCLVMDYVEGKMLLSCWESLGPFQQFRVACTMRKYISQLRRLPGLVPGTIKDGIVDGVLFDDRPRGPFKTALSFRRWCEMVAQTGWKFAAKKRRSAFPIEHPMLPPRGGDWSLVFTHGDLNLGNILLSDDGVLWIVDWAESGFFPPWMESMGIRKSWDAPASWRRFWWFMAGYYPKQEYFWDLFEVGLTHYIS